jgi:hypothetical protein
LGGKFLIVGTLENSGNTGNFGDSFVEVGDYLELGSRNWEISF